MNKTFKIGIFDDEQKFIGCVKTLLDRKVAIYEVFSPYPVHEVLHLLKRKTKLPTVAYFIGLAGALATLAFLYWSAVVNWPIVYGGKPFNSFPSFIVITIVLTILTVTIGSLFFFSFRSKLYPGRDNTIFNRAVTDDKFIIVVEKELVDESEQVYLAETMKEQGAVDIMDSEFENVQA